MANLIPFEKLEVGKSYYMYSRYWHEVLGIATITEVDIFTGRGDVETSWNPNEETGHGHCVVTADMDLFWDEFPTDKELRMSWDKAQVYYLPRKYEGTVYYGEFPDSWQKVLDELALKIKKTIIYDRRFKMGRDGGFFIWESKLNYNISEALIRPTGECDWDSIRYLKSKGLDIHSGERDSFGWITGVIELTGASIHKKILFG